ncbi:hypothetical protein [Streptomyces sp. NBC_00582]|uniref:hypothetical protein n=1 Tax=Streptomyces sp. NBC_00582 TaxID=2975783 RepID=UPI0010E6851B|nr:hypothetical protein [Streptomyces sp. NBC_00582]WUB59644.1 hypothetical protein OG852_04165 [Streptomyces sp. NBC_00582]
MLSGGLFTGPRALPVSAYPHIPGANERIAHLTGVSFGDGYRAALADGAVVMDSADAVEVRRLGVDSYPALLVHTAHGTDRLRRRAHPRPRPAPDRHHGRLKPHPPQPP